MLAASDIIEGAYYAMEQAGLLINDAASLYAQRRWPSSLVLAVFAMEELGKAEMLLIRGIDAGTSGDKTRTDVMQGSATHTTKLKAGRGTTTVTTAVSFWGDIPVPSTAEATALEQQLRAAEQIALDHAPAQAHAARVRALYVDLEQDERWARPNETGPSEAYLMVSAASIEYRVRREKFVNPTDPTVQRVFQQVGARLPALPVAPDVNWPNG